MANYKESEVGGTSWVRSNRISISNEFDGIPSISFIEEQMYNINNTLINKPYNTSSSPGGICASFDNPNKSFELINPDTGDIMGVARLNDLRVILHSLYIHLAKKRDLEEIS